MKNMSFLAPLAYHPYVRQRLTFHVVITIVGNIAMHVFSTSFKMALTIIILVKHSGLK